MIAKYVSVSAKSGDLNHLQLLDENLNLLDEHDGYVPPSAIGEGDYIDFTIDNETGRILDWKPITSLAVED